MTAASFTLSLGGLEFRLDPESAGSRISFVSGEHDEALSLRLDNFTGKLSVKQMSSHGGSNVSISSNSKMTTATANDEETFVDDDGDGGDDRRRREREHSSGETRHQMKRKSYGGTTEYPRDHGDETNSKRSRNDNHDDHYNHGRDTYNHRSGHDPREQYGDDREQDNQSDRCARRERDERSYQYDRQEQDSRNYQEYDRRESRHYQGNNGQDYRQSPRYEDEHVDASPSGATNNYLRRQDSQQEQGSGAPRISRATASGWLIPTGDPTKLSFRFAPRLASLGGKPTVACLNFALCGRFCPAGNNCKFLHIKRPDLYRLPQAEKVAIQRWVDGNPTLTFAPGVSLSPAASHQFDDNNSTSHDNGGDEDNRYSAPTHTSDGQDASSAGPIARDDVIGQESEQPPDDVMIRRPSC